jgi:hypothetical protein
MTRFVTEQTPVAGESPFTPEQLVIARHAVDRAVEETRMLAALLNAAEFSLPSELAPVPCPSDMTVLEHFGRSPTTDPREVLRRPLERVFNVRLDTRDAADQLEILKGKYRAIAAILTSDACLIGRVADAEYDRITAIVERASGFRYGIFLGGSFFADAVADTEQHRILESCAPTLGNPMALYRASILTHEAAHWANHDEARGLSGHGSHGALHDPYHYQQFLQEVCCGRSRIQSYAGEIEDALASRSIPAPGAPGCYGGSRRPGPVGRG